MKPGNALLIAAAAIVLLWVGCRVIAADRAESAATEAALAADTLVASQDTTRLLTLKLASLGDSLRVEQRRAVQVNQRADALDRALGLERTARESLAATIARYRGVVETDAVRETVLVAVAAAGARAGSAAAGGATVDTLRHGTFDIRQAPYTVRAQVALPPPPAAGAMALAIDLDTVRLEVRLGCGPPNAAGVRAAAATVTGPRWAAIQLGRVEQAPEVCATLGADQSRWGLVGRALARVGVSIGYVAGVGAHNTVFAGPGAIIGVKVWP